MKIDLILFTVAYGLFLLVYFLQKHMYEKMLEEERARHYESLEGFATFLARALYNRKLVLMKKKIDRDLRKSEYLWMRGFRDFMNGIEGGE